MPITTTQSINETAVRCRCGRLARGGILLGSPGLAECCGSKADRELLAAMLGDTQPASEPALTGAQVSRGFALGLTEPIVYRSTLTPAPRPHHDQVEYIDAVDGGEPMVERVTASPLYIGPVAPPALGTPAWIGGRSVREKSGTHG